MVPVHEIWREAKKIVGNTDDDFVFSRITQAVELLANKGDFDPTFGLLEIGVCADRIVALPPEVETILAVNICGHPAIGRNALFRFHINTTGPWERGERHHDRILWEWVDMGMACTYRELSAPSTLVAYCENADDVNSELWVYGEDQDGNTLRTKNSDDTWVDGVQIPVQTSYPSIPADAPLVARITRVRKSVTTGPVRLSTIDDDGVDGQLLGVYQWNETEPRLRRIRISKCANVITVAFKKSLFKVRSKCDLLPVGNGQSVIMMLRALKAYDKEDIATGEACEATALRWLEERDRSTTSENITPIQVWDETTRLNDPFDFVE